MSEYSEYMKKTLQEKGMTQRELAEKTGLTEVTISRYMAGERVPNIKNLKSIIDVLDIDVVEMFGLNKRTNADRIRAMSDEELADVIFKDGCFSCLNNKDEIGCSCKCHEGILGWLQSEVKESEE